MTDRPTSRRLNPLFFLVPLALAAVAPIATLGAPKTSATADSGEFASDPNWQPADPTAIAEELNSYLNAATALPDQIAQAREIWDAGNDPARGDLLDRLAAALAKADDRVSVLVDFCATTHPRGPLPDFAWLADSATPPLVRNNMRLYLARWLAQEGYYDEAISWTDGLSTSDVVAPDALLFYRAVAYHRLVEPDQADALVSRLIQRSDDLPLRYQKLADLMQQDMAGLEDESLDHIARRMEDIRRRLAQSSAGERVQQIEKGVADSLEKMIKQIEKQMQQQQSQSAAGSSGGQQAQTPMEDSQIAELKAPGHVDRRDIGHGSGWGNLPEKDREKALQDIGREFPSHYREVIEEYFRRLAAEESAEKP